MSRSPGVVFDFDQTLAETSTLSPFRDARDWAACAKAAPGVPLFEGVSDVISALDSRGHRLYIASSAPRSYLDNFLPRLPRAFAGVMSYRKADPILGLSRRSAIKVAQLREVRAREGSRSILFVGDDQDDAAAAIHTNVPFIHACWGGECDSVTGIHLASIDRILQHIQESEDH